MHDAPLDAHWSTEAAHLIDALKLDDLLHGPEDLLASDAHVVGDVAEHLHSTAWIAMDEEHAHGRLHEVARVRRLASATVQLGALLLARLDHLQDLAELLGVHLGASGVV